ncbi:MAG: alpha/beta fold hydrolase [Pirellulaceae bacterium]
MYDTRFKTLFVDDVKVFYREAGDVRRPTILLLHGLPTSSHMFRDLIGRLADRFHVLAPDYPGFGNSDCPEPDNFPYTFDHLSLVIEKFVGTLGVERSSLYMQGAGVGVGLRMCVRHPSWIESLIIQNGNAYEDGFTDSTKPWFEYWKNRTVETEAAVKRFISREGIVWQYVDGVRDRELISPDAWNMDCQPLNGRIQLELLYDYRKNVEEYPRWQAYFREHQPPLLVLWGRNDPIFSVEGAMAYQRDLRDVEFHLLDSGHFALEDCGYEIGQHVISFLDRVVMRELQTAIGSGIGARSPA